MIAKRNKKGIEMSLNFMITVIIGITILFFGVRFILGLAGEASELDAITFEQLDNRIGQLLCDSTDLVCIGIDRKTIKRGEHGVFGMKMINIEDKQDFDVRVTQPVPNGYNSANDPISGSDIRIVPRTRTITLDRNEEKTVGIAIEIPRTIEPGTYIFDVRVQPYNTLNKLYVEVS